MSGLEVLGALLGLYPLVVDLAKGYRGIKGGNSELHRVLMVTVSVYDNTVKNLLASAVSYEEVHRLAPSHGAVDQTLWEDPVLQQKLRDRIGGDTLDLALVHLSEIKTLLHQVKTELTTMSRSGTADALHRARMKLEMTLANMPQSAIQGRVKCIRALNEDLRRLLDDRPFMRTYHQQPPETIVPTPLVTNVTRTGISRASEFFEAIKEKYTRRCTSPHAIGLGCACNTCAQPLSEKKLDLHAADEWEFRLGFNPPGADGSASKATTIILQSIPEAAATSEIQPVSQDMCSLVADLATTSKPHMGELVLGTAKTKARDKRLQRMKLSKIAAGSVDAKRVPNVQSFYDLRAGTLSPKSRLELAVRLSLAVLQLWETPWVSKSWTWSDVFVAKMNVPMLKGGMLVPPDDAAQGPESKVLFILNRRVYSVAHDGKQPALKLPVMAAAATATRAVDILDEEPAMTKLGLALCELALGRSMDEMRRDYGFHDMAENMNDVADICTARKLLNDQRIRERAGRDYESVVDVCLKRRFVDAKGMPRSLWSKHPSFLPSSKDVIIRPLYLMWKRF